MMQLMHSELSYERLLLFSHALGRVLMRCSAGCAQELKLYFFKL